VRRQGRAPCLALANLSRITTALLRLMSFKVISITSDMSTTEREKTV
jgi:hypothetical protein